MSSVTSQAVVRRPRAFIRVSGPDAEDFLQRMVSNDVAAADVCDALLLTPKARMIAPLRIMRRTAEDFLLLTEPDLGEPVRAQLLRARFAAKVEIEPEQHTSAIVFGGDEGIPTADYGGPAREVLDAGLEPTLAETDLERLRIEAGTPRYGHELDENTTPIEAGLGFFVALDKGDFIGRSVLAGQKEQGVSKKCVAFKMAGKSAPPRPRYPIWSAGPEVKQIGEVVSGTQSPSLGIGIGMGYVPPPFAKPGTAIEIEIRGKRFTAVVVPKPIYRKPASG